MNERVIFDAALEIADPRARRAFVEKACAGNPELLAAVESLLKSNDAATSFLETPAAALPQPDSADVGDKTLQSKDGDADSDQDDESTTDLSFLQPSTKPGSIGVLGHYEVLQVLGQGAFGIVLKAFDEKLHRLVAIKVMNPRLAATSPPRKRFLREARAAAAIRHENVVQVHSVEEQPLPYLVMEFIEGQTLQHKLDGVGPLDPAEILHIARQIAAGLAAAQGMGLIHRDIKPGNILLEQGAEQKVKITDFGLARAADDASLTRTGVISGTPMYMAPEQALGQALDQRTDLFSLGSVLYQMACGRPPFRAETTLAVLRRVAEDTPRPLQEILPEIPDWLVAIIVKLQQKKPADRFQSAKEVADLLARCQSELQLKGAVTCVPQTQKGEDLAQPQRPREGEAPAEPQRQAESANRTDVAKSFSPLPGTPGRGAGGEGQSHGAQPLSDPNSDKVVRALRDRNPSSHGETRLLSRRPWLIAVVLLGAAAVAGIFFKIRHEDKARRLAALGRPSDTINGNAKTAEGGQPTNPSGWHGWPADAPKPAIAPFDAVQAKKHQEAWAKYLNVPVEYTNTIGMKFRLIPPGEFLMGMTKEEAEAVAAQATPVG